MKKILTGLAIVSSLAFAEIEICPFTINSDAIKHYEEARKMLRKHDIRESARNLELAEVELKNVSEAFKCSNKYLLSEIDFLLAKMK